MRNPVRIAALTSAFVLVVSGCAGSGDKKSEEFAVQGCAAGALGGATLGALTGGSDKAKSAALGAAAGCAAGAVVGYQIGARTDEYASEQEAVATEIARSDKNLTEVRDYNAQLIQNIQDYEQHIAELKSSALGATEKQNNLTETRELVLQQREQAFAAYNSVNQEFKTAVQQYSKYKSSAVPAEAEGWRQQLVALQEERNLLGSHVNSLNALSASI